MFKLFGKKQTTPEPERPAREKSPELQAFAAAFLPEEFTLLGVTGSGVTGMEPLADSGLSTACIGLTAWMREEDGAVVSAPARLVALGDEKLLGYLRQRIPRNFILKVRVRADREGESRFLMVGLPEPGFDPELKAIAEEQKKPVTFDDPDLGQFTLDIQADWFVGEGAWLEQSVQLVLDRSEDRAGALATARALLDGASEWNGRLRDFAGRTLEGQAPWSEDGGQLTAAQLTARLEAESVQVWADGRFEFWFHDSGMFWTHAVKVEGTLEQGPLSASAEA